MGKTNLRPCMVFLWIVGCASRYRYGPARCLPNQKRVNVTRRTSDRHGYLYEKRGYVGSYEYAGDEAWFHKEVLVHVQMTRQTTEEDVVGCDECARLTRNI